MGKGKHAIPTLMGYFTYYRAMLYDPVDLATLLLFKLFYLLFHNILAYTTLVNKDERLSFPTTQKP